MATYLQGVTDYIPQFQPFQPDLNFYNNVLQTKQTQYDSNYKQLNKVYGNYFYADLTHGDNIQRKEELLKNIDVSLKKVSGLDLSLEQNVTQATQVFKPFYEDQYLMKDMAFTKNYSAQRNRAEGLKNSTDEKKRAMYWDDGVAALDFQREEFKESAIGDTLGIANASYTNYVNVQEKAMKLTKEAGLSIESVDFSPDGKYIVTTKNGEQLMEPLSKLLESQLGSDPAIQEVYKTQAYVNRKSFAAQNAAQFGGDKNAAEMNYLETNFNRLKEQQQRRFESLQDDSKSYSSRITDLQSQIDKGNRDPDLPKELARLQQGKQINDDVLARVQKDNDTLKTDQSTATTSTGFVNPYGDVKSLRWKVDSAMASTLMEKDLDESAQIFAFRDAKQSMVADPFAVSAQNHSYRMQEVASANASRERVSAANNAAADRRAKNNWDLTTGVSHYDTEKYIKDADGNDIPNPNYNQVVANESYSNIFSEFEDKDITTGEVNSKSLSRNISKRQTDQYALPYMQQSLALLDKLVIEGVMTQKQANSVLHTTKDKSMTVERFKNGMASNSEHFLRNTVGSESLYWINKKLNAWIKNNKKISAITKDGIPGYAKASTNFNTYVGYLKQDQTWRKETSKFVEDAVTARFMGDKEKANLAKYLYDEKGNLRSEEQFYNVINGTKGSDKMKRERAELSRIGKTIANIPSLEEITAYASGNPKLIASAVRKKGQEILDSEKFAADSGVYKELRAAAGKAYASSKIKKAPPGISIVGEMSGAGLFTPSRQSINVAPLAFGTKGNAYFHEFSRDFRKIDFATSGISFNGTARTDDTDKGKRLINDMIMAMNDTKSKFKNFKMSSQAIAGGSADKGAMILYPDADWLKDYLKTEKGAGLIEVQDYNDILANGISVVSNANNWSNGLYTSSYLDPLQSIVESNPNGYEWNDDYGNVNLKIKKNEFGTGDYSTTSTYRLLNHETGEYYNSVQENNTQTLGSNLTQVLQNKLYDSERVRQYNKTGY